MNPALRHEITAALQHAFGNGLHIVSITPAAGSSFSSTARVTLQNCDALFAKYAVNPPHGIFHREYEALRFLHGTQTLRVPEPVCSGDEFIVTRWIQFGSRAPDWQEAFGRGLALLHLARQSSRYGFDRDNYLGASVQRNDWHESWLDFWRQCRLGPQLAKWQQRAANTDELLKLGDRLLQRLDAYLGAVREPGVLLHGDLWAGNAAADRDGNPVIYDPASYHGHREAEFGMMRLFGGFGPRVEAAYREVWPFESGSEDRIVLYRLYHELNHLNLFGTAYYSQCLATIKALL
jgi:fructosamine-3-kinase